MRIVELQPGGNYSCRIEGDGVHKVGVSARCLGGFLGLFRTSIVMDYASIPDDGAEVVKQAEVIRQGMAGSLSFRTVLLNDVLPANVDTYLVLANPTNKKVRVKLEIFAQRTHTEEVEYQQVRRLARLNQPTPTGI